MTSKWITRFDVEQSGDTITVYVGLMDYFDYRCKEKVRMNTSDVISILNEKGIKIDKCIQSDSLQNRKKTFGVWVFSKTKVKPIPKPKSQVRNKKNYKKTQKKLDNQPKDVIIKETPTEE